MVGNVFSMASYVKSFEQAFRLKTHNYKTKFVRNETNKERLITITFHTHDINTDFAFELLCNACEASTHFCG